MTTLEIQKCPEGWKASSPDMPNKVLIFNQYGTISGPSIGVKNPETVELFNKARLFLDERGLLPPSPVTPQLSKIKAMIDNISSSDPLNPTHRLTGLMHIMVATRAQMPLTFSRPSRLIFGSIEQFTTTDLYFDYDHGSKKNAPTASFQESVFTVQYEFIAPGEQFPMTVIQGLENGTNKIIFSRRDKKSAWLPAIYGVDHPQFIEIRQALTQLQAAKK